MKKITYENITGCLLGGATGDVLGAPVEFFSTNEIKKKFGAKGIVDFSAAYGNIGSLTDDTQMTLFTSEGLLRAHCKGCRKGIRPDFVSTVYQSYLRWLITQGEGHATKQSGAIEDGWLIKIPELHHRRAPGTTCLSALQSGHMGTVEKPLTGC